MVDPLKLAIPEAILIAADETTATAGTGDHAPRPGSETDETLETNGSFPNIPRYTIIRQIGRGGMGIVYEAMGPLGVRVALKVIHPEKRRPVLMARFQQEAKAMMDLDHPNLIRIYDYGEHSGGPYFTMKLLPGPTLANLISDLWRDPQAAVQLASQISAAVGFLHSRRKVHRDLKPNNVLLDERSEPIVSDFGLIKETGEVEIADVSAGPTPSPGYSSTLTHTGDRIGTVAYMSPEQAAGDLARIGPQTDVWSLGVMIHEMVWGKRPRFTEAGEVDFLDWSEDSPEPDIVTRLRPLISRCLLHELDRRYHTANELRIDLESLLTPPVAPILPAASGQAPVRWFRRIGWTGVIALAIVGAIGTGWWAIGPRGKDSHPIVTVDPLTAIQNELAEKGEVDLLSTEGAWRWHEWMTGTGEWHKGPHEAGPIDARGWFSSTNGDILLLEVARGLSGYRLLVELADIGPSGTVGIYSGRSIQNVKELPMHCMLAVQVRDHGLNAAPNGRAQVARFLLARRCPATIVGGFFDAPELDRSVLDRNPGGWTEISVALNANEVVAWHEGLPFKTQSRNKLMQTAGRQLGFAVKGADGLTPTFQPTEGLGVFVDGGTVAIRSARLLRLEN